MSALRHLGDPSERNPFMDGPSTGIVSYRGAEYSFEPHKTSSIGLTSPINAVQIFFRRKWWVAGAVLVGLIGGLLFSLSRPKMYRSRVTLEIYGLNDNYLNIKEVDPTARGEYDASDIYLQTQLEVLQSKTLVGDVIKELGLVNRPELFDPATPLRSMKQRIRGASQRPAITFETARAIALSNLKVRLSGPTRIVEISYSNPDPDVAAEFVNAVANKYITVGLETRTQATEHTRSSLEKQLLMLKAKLVAAGDSLQAFTRSNGLTITNEKNSVAEERLRQVQQDRSVASADRALKQARYEAAIHTSPDAVPEVLDFGPLREYQLKLAELRRQLAEASSILTPTSYKVKRIQDQIAELEHTAAHERTNVINRLKNEYDTALRREELVSAEYTSQARLVSDQSSKLIRYNLLNGELESNRALYEAMVRKVREASISSAMRPVNAHVLDAAEPASAPSAPNHSANAAVGLVSGMLLGVALALVRERTDSTVRKPGDCLSFFAVPELGAIPAARSDHYLPALGSGLGLLNRKPSKPFLEDDQGGMLTEGFRDTLVSIRNSGRNPRVILVTSPHSGEGKTTTTAHLGVALARIQNRVLIIDGDIRRPSVHNLFNGELAPGLTDLLGAEDAVTEAALKAAVHKTEYAGLAYLSGGNIISNGPDLLHSQRMAELLEVARRGYDHVLIDTAPVLPISDARVLGRMSDGVILVLRADKTTKQTAIVAMHKLAEDAVPVLGTVLNHFNPKTTEYRSYAEYFARS